MSTKAIRDEAGYSMVEVLVAILILSIAIIPMFTMFDSALRSADTSSDYDRARTFANQKLEEAKSQAYDDVADRFPEIGTALETPDSGSSVNSATGDADGQTGSSDANGPYPGLTYRVTKQYVMLNSSNVLASSTQGDEGLVKVTVTACWNDVDSTCGNGNGTEYNAVGVVSR